MLCLSRLALSLIFNAYAGVMPLVREDWQMSAATAATIQSAWHLGYLVSLFVVGILADRYGARRTYLVSASVAALAAVGFAFGSQGYASALALYGIAGLCSGGSYTPGLALIYQHVDPRARGRAMGWFLAASSLGYAAALGANLEALARGAGEAMRLSSFCTVFAKTEILSHLARGVPVTAIVRGAFQSVVARIIEMDPLDGEVVMTGGVVAHNPTVAAILADRIGRPVAIAPEPQFVGALGAALVAWQNACQLDGGVSDAGRSL